jgi:alginate O-acetyltransferase complex protein AlgJ
MTRPGDNPSDTPAHSRWACLVATATFLALLLIPGVYHLAFGVRDSDLRRWGTWLRTKPAAEAIREIDTDFERRFLFRFMAVALTADVPVLVPRYDNRTTRVGTDGFRFTTDDIAVCTSAGFLNPRFPRAADAADQLIDLDRQLKERGIHLLFVPVPPKVSIYPDRLYPRYDPAAGPFLNVDHARWFARLRDAGVDAIDLADLFWAHRNDPDGLLFYPADSHWTDRAKHLAAQAIAERLAPLLSDLPRRSFATRTVTVTAPTDLADRAGPPPPTTREQVHQLFDDRGNLVPGDDAPLLLIGDSYAALGYEAGYGFAQRITELTGVPVHSAAAPGLNGNSTRQALADHPDLLRGKRVVILTLTLRHVLHHDWEPVRIPTTP